MQPLPVDAVLPELAAALAERRAAVLKAPTGSGKTTRVPPALAEALVADGRRRVVVLEPRRLAARAAARRIAAEREWRLGGEVGYRVRFDTQESADTRLLVVTEGVLVRMLQDDPFLDGVAAVVFDEFHERHLETDLALAMTERVAREVRPDLVRLVMSATLDPGPVAEYLGGCPVIETGGRLHPVEIRYADRRPERAPRALGRAVARAAEELLDDPALAGGDVLAFLPGVAEIRAAADALAESAARRRVDVVPLYGDLPPAEQDRALSPAGGRRVVLATNVAESSVTVPGVRAVVDTGLARVPAHDAGAGLDRLAVVRVSRASADQRAGRAGREAPGVCLRLWPEIEHRALPARDEPAIRRLDLAGTVLELLAWGETDPAALPWFEPPPPGALERAALLLERLGAIERGADDGGGDGGDPGNRHWTLTPLGRTLARLPVHPRLARLVVEGARHGELEAAALAAALLAERPAFGRGGDRDGRRASARSDVLLRLDALEAFAGGRAIDPGLPMPRRGAARFVLAARDRLAGLARRALGSREARAAATNPQRSGRDEALLRAIFAAHPDRLVRRRAPGDDRGVMVGGRGVRLARESAVVEPELFVAVDVDAGRAGERAEALVRAASAVERDWLPAERLSEETVVGVDPERGRVTAVRRTRWEDLVLDEREVPVTDDAVAAAALAAAAAEHPERALPLDDREVAGLLERLVFLRRAMPELELPAFELPADDAARRQALAAPPWRDLLAALAAGRRSFAELRRAPLADLVRGVLGHARLQALDRNAPERLAVPSGSRVRLDYSGDGPPVLAVRIQEVFGLAETPRVAGGRVPVLLHLLAPNMRPQQVTDDLASFWRRTYPEIKKELAGRYPKHAWPDDPLAARPEARPGRRR